MVLFSGLWNMGLRTRSSGDYTPIADTNDNGEVPHEDESQYDVTNGDDDNDEEMPSLTGDFTNWDTKTVLAACAFYTLIYVVVAVIAFSFVFEHWTIIDSIYFAVSTFRALWGAGWKDLETDHKRLDSSL